MMLLSPLQETGVLLTAIMLISEGDGYCAGAGANPGFRSAPHVEQVKLTSVLVSWDGLVTRPECADQFLVKSWLYLVPNDYKISELLTTDTFSYVVEDLMPGNQYMFQVVAREDKGLLGKDWNKSPPTRFSTSPTNPTVRPASRGGVPGDRGQPLLSGKQNEAVSNVDRQASPPAATATASSLGQAPETEGNAGPFSAVLTLVIVALVGFLLLLVSGAVYNTMRLTTKRGKSSSISISESESEGFEINTADGRESEAGIRPGSSANKHVGVQTRDLGCPCSSPEISRKPSTFLQSSTNLQLDSEKRS